jgi:hypothetical protein
MVLFAPKNACLRFISCSTVELKTTGEPMTATSNIDPVRDALNRHGVFLKKTVLSKLRVMDPHKLTVFEEIGTWFGGTRVADIVAMQKFAAKEITVFFVIECKRVDPEKQWIFLKHYDKRFRVRRETSDANPESTFHRPPESENRVCSEGYEFPAGKDKAADNDPVFKAAAQLSSAFLGFIHRRQKRRFRERYVPILVTTAQLSVVDDWPIVPLATGRLTRELNRTTVTDLVLKHPFPTPTGVESDFRERVPSESWADMFTESIYIVQAESLVSFLRPEFRESLGD